MKWLLLLLIFVSALGVQADELPIPRLQDFDAHYRPKLLKEFCNPDEFLKCLPVSEAECKREFGSLYLTCREKVITKNKLVFENFSSESFSKLGQCLGNAIQNLKPVRSNVKWSSQCQTRL
jgi:hypothetical protein